MQKFILIVLVLGLGFFLYLLQTGQINKSDFTINKFKGDARFEIRKTDPDSSSKSSDIYAIIKDKEYKLYTFSGDDFHNLLKIEYAAKEYRVPINAIDAVSGVWIGNRYVLYVTERINLDNKKIYEIYKAEYATDDSSAFEYFKIKTVREDEINGTFEIKY